MHIQSYYCEPNVELPIPVAERSKARICGRSLAGIVGSNLAEGMDVSVVCCHYTSLRRADQPSGEVLLPVVCHCVIYKPQQLGGPGSSSAVVPSKKKKKNVSY